MARPGNGMSKGGLRQKHMGSGQLDFVS